MNEKQKQAILQFMWLVFCKEHPYWDEYPMEAMQVIEETRGSLDDTEYSGTYMAEAFYMKQAIDNFEKN